MYFSIAMKIAENMQAINLGSIMIEMMGGEQREGREEEKGQSFDGKFEGF